MAGPIDPRLIRRARATRGYLVAGVAVGSATAILTLGQAWLLSRSVADIFATRNLSTLSWAVGGLVLVAAGLVAEHLCTIRKDDDDEHPGPPEPGLGLSHHD